MRRLEEFKLIAELVGGKRLAKRGWDPMRKNTSDDDKVLAGSFSSKGMFLDRQMQGARSYGDCGNISAHNEQKHNEDDPRYFTSRHPFIERVVQ